MTFANGPLPAELRPAAYLTQDEGEWALPNAEALAYLRWATDQGLEVSGFDVWAPITPGPGVCSGDGGFDGNSEECATAIETRDFSYIRDVFGIDPVFNIWVKR